MKKDYFWNPSTCAYECDKDCDMSEYLKHFPYMKSLVDDLVVTCDQIIDILELVVISSSNGINYWLIAAVLLAIS